ncbi:phosphoglycerate mutase-like protein [Aspergillus ellipticus CBS 707.79]|uniref:Phosphoglycerate mutase-like protein n=1 Tax=Aspergillus ellipticus CBS 707.79 TaxID=1448320 RepID=A0A319D4U5_9EURO|nr:phosphoglycerate mutase-like protein [Aspergillus ellipticus CBS 707.79]
MKLVRDLALALALGLAASAQASSHLAYTTVPGYFLQDEASTDPSTFDFTTTNFGLINRTYDADADTQQEQQRQLPPPHTLTQWERFHRQVLALNRDAPSNVAYKVLFLGRHGQGWHNVAEEYYGTPAWNCYYSLLPGNATTTWSDADLTPLGETQALNVHTFWQTQLTTQRIPLPSVFYVSPLTRAMRTLNLTFAGLIKQHLAPREHKHEPAPESEAISSTNPSPLFSLFGLSERSSNPNPDPDPDPTCPAHLKYTPHITPLFRESITIHTCDHRRNRTSIHALFPTWTLPPENIFPEDDEQWDGIHAETTAGQDGRSRRGLDLIFHQLGLQLQSQSQFQMEGKDGDGDEDGVFVSVTSHSGEIASVLRVIGHREFGLATGAVIPVLVRGERVSDSTTKLTGTMTTTTTAVSWTRSAHCTEPPVTSVTGCVCRSGAPVVTTAL